MMADAVCSTIMMDVCKLSPRERHAILDVMIRDENLRRKDEQRIRRMKSELQELRRRGALRPSSLDSGTTTTTAATTIFNVSGSNRCCNRCRAELGWIVNRGAVCQACRLRVCKACREYRVRTVDWVCSVCYKRTQIQAASGEWMNEFLRKPAQWRYDHHHHKFYMSAADIIKSTIRRSWTICDPNYRWPSSRDSPKFRPYNSLPRGRDVTDYQLLLTTDSNQVIINDNNPLQKEEKEEEQQEDEQHKRERRVSQFERTLTELYGVQNTKCNDDDDVEVEKTSSPKNATSRRKLQCTRSDSAVMPELKQTVRKQTSQPTTSKKAMNESEKRVSFDDNDSNKKPSVAIVKRDSKKHLTHTTNENNDGVSDNNKCDVEQMSGTVFRKVTIRRRRQDFRKTHAFDEGGFSVVRRRRPPPPPQQTNVSVTTTDDVLNVDAGGILLPDGNDYRLVFISSDSSSKDDDDDEEEDEEEEEQELYVEDNDSFTVDDCDWDYFEPCSGGRGPSSVLCRASPPFGSPRLYRRTIYRSSDTGTDEDITRIDSAASSDSPAPSDSFMDTEHQLQQHLTTSIDTTTTTTTTISPCQNCGSITAQQTQFVPIPVLVPIPVPIWNPFDPIVLYNTSSALDCNLRAYLRAIQQRSSFIWPCVNQASLISTPISSDNSIIAANVQGNSSSNNNNNNNIQRDDDDDDNANSFIEMEQNLMDEQQHIAESCYLQSEHMYISSDEDEDSSELDEGVGKVSVHRSYDVNGSQNSDENIQVGSSCSSSSSSSPSCEDDFDSDDTGTVADKKCRKFSKVFVVNRNSSSSSSDVEDNTDSSRSSISANDSDTTEPDGGMVVLNYIRAIPDDAAAAATTSDHDATNHKRELCDADNGIILIKHRSYYNNENCDAADIHSNKISLIQCETENNQNANENNFSENIEHECDIYKFDSNSESVLLSLELVPLENVLEIINKNENETEKVIDTGESSPVAFAAQEEVLEGIHGTGGEAHTTTGVPAARYTSLVMITQDVVSPRVSVIPTDTTTIIVSDNIVVQHTNYYETSEETVIANNNNNNERTGNGDGVTVVTGSETLSAVLCLEEGLADDDSWVEDVSHDEDEFATTTATDSSSSSSSGEEVTVSASSLNQEEEEEEEDLRGHQHRSAIDFTLHTIVEESCEDSEVEQSHVKNKARPTSATDLEKYFFFHLGDGLTSNREDAFSETSSIYSEGMDSLGTTEDVKTNDSVDPAELASSRLEKYFLSGFMGFTAERRDSDGSVGSDSEGRPSPEQRRKKLVRARGTGRSHSSSLDNLLANSELSADAQQQSNDNNQTQLQSEDSSSSEIDVCDETISNFEKSDGQFDTVKRKKSKRQRMLSGGSISPHDDKKGLEIITLEEECKQSDGDDDDDDHKTPQPEFFVSSSSSSDLTNNKKQQSRDSGFIGSCDDLLKEQKVQSDSNNAAIVKTLDTAKNLTRITEETTKPPCFQHNSLPPATTLTRKDSFNNWSSDEETNLMMSKMRQFFKSMVAANTNNNNSKPTTPILGKHNSNEPIPKSKIRNKPPQLVYFENELTRLMKTVPGIRDDQVREIVEYLSSEDTWSDSYDSSDYTSSDLEGNVGQKSVLQQQISASCQQIINKFDKPTADDGEGDEGDGGILDESQCINRETAFVYQKLVASFNKMTNGGDEEGKHNNGPHNNNNSPPLIAKVMHHIGSRLVALMHEVSSGESHCSSSPKVRYHHRRLQSKLSTTSSTTTEDDDSTSDTNVGGGGGVLEEPYNLPRSKSHDMLLGETRTHHQSSSDTVEERETSDYERFSWRGSFESALMATDSRTKLSILGSEGSASASALMAAKRRSAGDLLFSPKSLSREQLDRVRSCGSIGGSSSEDKHWVVTSVTRPNRRRSSVPDASCGSADGEDGDEEEEEEEVEDDMEGGRSTLPTATTNSLPRLPTSATAANMQKAHSVYHFLQHNVKSARYRPPGFNRSAFSSGPKRATSAPGLQPTTHQRREVVRRRLQQPLLTTTDDVSDSNASPVVQNTIPSPIHGGGSTLNRGSGSISSADWQEDDIDRLVAMHQNRNSLSSLGLRSDSMASVYSGAGEGRYGIVAVRGQIEFALQYNYKAAALEIHMKQCKDLAAVDVKRQRSDPYVKVYLLPDKSKSGKRKTKVKKHTLNPVFDECLKFHLSLSGLETRTLWLTVWHSDMFGRNDFLGEVMMPLENKVFDDPTPKWYHLQERTEPFEELPSYKGDIIIGLKFVPPDVTVQKKGKRSRGSLHVLVKEAKNLTAVKVNGTSDPFCKSYLLPDKGRSNKQKTPILRRTTNPTWNHSFVYDDVTLQELTERSLELTVWDHDRLASNEFLGGVRFSLGTGKHYGKPVDWMDGTGKELSLWQSMLERPNFWVEGSVTLRPSLDNTNS